MKNEFILPEMIPQKLKRGGNALRIIIWAVLFSICLLLRYVFHFDHKLVRLGIMAFGIFTASNFAVMLISFFEVKNHRGRTLITISMSLIKYVAALVVLCWGLRIMGVDLSTIVTSVGILALIVGFGAESMIADVVTGIFMLFENQYNVGDIVEVDGLRGKVSNIGIRTTSIIDASGNTKIINNSDMTNVLNRSNGATYVFSDIGIPYETDLEAFEKELPALLASIYEAHTDIMKSAPTYLGVQALDASAVTLRFRTEVPEREIYNTMRVMNRDLLIGFRKLGIEVPFTQIDIHNK